MTAHDFCSTLFSGFDLTKKCFPHTFLAPQAAKNLSVRLNTCLNTSFLVSTPADQHLSPRLNTWLLNAESCLTSEPQALFCAASFTRGGSAAVVRLDTSFAMVGARSGSCTPWRCLGG